MSVAEAQGRTQTHLRYERSETSRCSFMRLRAYEGTSLDADAVREAIRYADEATWQRLLPEP